MTPRKLALAAEIAAAYVRVRLTLRRHRDVRNALALLRAETRAPAANGDPGPVRLAHAVTRVLDRLPADSRCLTQSLVLAHLLSRRGIGGTVVIGVRPGSSFGAHAWVELDGVALLPRDETEFARLVEL
jgi:hypothetical protein